MRRIDDIQAETYEQRAAEMDEKRRGKAIKLMVMILGVATALVVVLAVVFKPFGIVDNGEAGLFVRWGEIKGDVLNEGLYFYEPIGTRLVCYDVKNHVGRVSTEQYTKDIQQAKIELAVTYCLDRSRIAELHRKTGKKYFETIINPAVLGTTKDVMGKWEAAEFISHRNEAVALVSEALGKKLEPFGIRVVLVELLDIAFSDQFEKAVEEKQVAEQNAIKEKNNTRKIAELANQEVVKAEAEAKAQVVKAEAEAKAIEIKSSAEAKAISLKGEALSANRALIDYEWALKWNGTLPTHTLGGNIVPWLNVDGEAK